MIEMWAGHECSLTRVQDRFFDQSERSGHSARAGDLERFAALGVKKLRYPLLWENGSIDRGVAAIERLRDLGIDPIVGLIHHGSGPLTTSLIAEDFASGLARHAAEAAERLPWVTHWTPVNEPLTTARFALLYGHWYPHMRDEAAFWLGLLNQIDAIRDAMLEIRRVNPSALLLQTEDFGRTWATPPVQRQADFDNERRWMTWDLLLGRVTDGHPLYQRLVEFGFEQRLAVVAADPSPPDIIGLDHYLTSDRFLDHDVGNYSSHTHGGSPISRYADVEAVRVLDPPADSCLRAITEAWERYRLPLALTEVHNGCTREEQMRWLAEAWATANDCRKNGIDIRAVTAWSLLGAFDWDSLMTCPTGSYECGAFDIRSAEPRPTAVAGLVRELATKGEASHPALDGVGWWRQPSRLNYPAFASGLQPIGRRSLPPRKLLIVGATGTLGQAFGRACGARNLACVAVDRQRCPLEDEASISTLLDDVHPWTVINAAGWVRVDEAELDPDGCCAANTAGSLRLAAQCGKRGIPFATFSSDLVFDGEAGRDYFEDDIPAPLNVYGHSKARADAGLLQQGTPALVVRTAAFFSPHDPYNFATQLVAALRSGHRFDAASDLTISPTYVPDLVDTVLDLVIDGEVGLWHLANPGAVTWAAFATQLAEAIGLDAGLIESRPASMMGWRAARPLRASLTSARGVLLPKLEFAIERFARAVRDVPQPVVFGPIRASRGFPPVRPSRVLALQTAG